MKDNLQRSFITDETKDQALVGCLLGDSSFEPTFINVMHSILYEDYLLQKYDGFSKFFNVGRIGISNNWGSNPNPELRKAVRFRILRDQSYTKYALEDYREVMLDEDGRRQIPVAYLGDLITPECLFFWFFDDGHLIVRRPTDKYGYFRRRIAITLKSFKDEQITSVMKFLNQKYGLDFKAESEKGKIVRIQTGSVNGISRFLELLQPFKDFFPKSMIYKVNPCFREDALQHLNIGD